MDDESMWAADRVVALTPDPTITIPKIVNELAIKAFTDEGSSNSDTDKIMAGMDAMTMKIDAQYKEIQSRANHATLDCNDDDTPMSREEESKFIQTFRRRYDVSAPELHKKPQRLKGLYAVSRRSHTKYSRISSRNILEYYNRGAYAKKPQYARETERALKNEFPAIVYNDALASKSDFSPKPTVSPQHIDEVNLKNETSLSKYDGEEYNVISFNDLFPFNVIYADDLESDKDNDNDKIDIEQSSRDLSIELLLNEIKIDTQGSNKLLETSHDTIEEMDLQFAHVVAASKVPMVKVGEYDLWKMRME
ncbi:hypothetical protein Tco_0088444 [Tanacetum coccineum]